VCGSVSGRGEARRGDSHGTMQQQQLPQQRPVLTLQDHHTISGGWGPFETKFVVTGHEVIGKVVEVGSAVTQFKVGQRVGVGAQVGSCGECKACKKDLGESRWRSLGVSAPTLTRRKLLPHARARLQHALVGQKGAPGRVLYARPRARAVCVSYPGQARFD
jgi:hypothetical protein